MRKNELIKLLSELKGNPEILLWNGMVGDWMPISKKLVETDLVRRDSKSEWVTGSWVSEKDIKTGLYKKKRVVYIDAKRRGVRTFDRTGILSY